MLKENNNNIIYSTIILPELPSYYFGEYREFSDLIKNILICVLNCFILIVCEDERRSYGFGTTWG